MAGLRVLRLGRASAAALSAMSRDALDRPLQVDAELVIAQPADEAIVLGALQRGSELPGPRDPSLMLRRRGSCGGEARVGPGSLWLQLALARPGALVPCEPSRLLNRYVRPLLRALTRVGALTHYFDRDWLSASKRPVGMISFAHDARTGRALVEAIVAVATPFAIRTRPSTMGKEPATLAELGVPADPGAVADAIASAYESAYGAAPGEPLLATSAVEDREAAPEPPWTATRAEAIGLVGAGRDHEGRWRLGGELMVSRDAREKLEAAIAALPSGADAEVVGDLVDATLGAPGVALFGVRSLRSIRDVIVEALARDSVAQ